MYAAPQGDRSFSWVGVDVQRSLVARMRPHLTGVLQTAGFACMAFAAGMWLLPVGIALGGAFLVLTGWLVERDA